MVNERIRAQLIAALQLRPAELIRTRELALSRLAAGDSVATTEIWAAVAADMDINPNAHVEIDVFDALRDDAVAIDPDTPGLRKPRLHRTVKEVLAELDADGHIVPMDVPDGGLSDINLSVSNIAPGGGGSRGGVSVPMPAPAVARSYRLSRRLIDDAQWRDVATSVGSTELVTLLGQRGSRCWEEALAAHRRGLYLAAANMVGAASEAAWYTLGELLRDSDTAIAKAVDDDATARVIARVADRLKLAPRQASVIPELHAHAGYLRDLRNYGLHPRASSDDARELPFTETGSLTVIMQTHRYLTRLLAAARAAEVPL